MKTYDAILIGAGGAGMNLLLEMQQSAYLDTHRVLVLEPDSKEVNDRTWCFWAKPDEGIVNRLQPIISGKWIANLITDQKKPLEPFNYYHIKGEDFYRYVKRSIAKNQNICWKQEKATGLKKTENHVIVYTEKEQFSAKKVFDSRLTQEQQAHISNASTVWQSFVGYRVRLANPIPDNDAIRLMDFNIPQQQYCQFMYLLPTSPKEALVEFTRFGNKCLTKIDSQNLLHHWIKSHLGNYEILEEEQGRIPMTNLLKPKNKEFPTEEQVIPIGTAAGNIKGTTGFAFKAMHEHAQKIVSSLQTGKPIPTPYQKGRFAFYDNLLLAILTLHPQWGKRIFESLFRSVPMPKILTFLSEKTSLRQDIGLLFSLPFTPFLWALFHVNIKPLFTLNQWKWAELFPVFIGLALLSIGYINPKILEEITLPLFILGMLFPGIPHGALDHRISITNLNGVALSKFVLQYLSIMGLILLLWVIAPVAGILFFLAYSAWHFGETDLRSWGIFHPILAVLQGFGVLAFILSTHSATFLLYLEMLGVPFDSALLQTLLLPMAVISFICMVIIGYWIPAKERKSWILTFITVCIGSFLPLLLAFGLYFIGIHSVRGWNHLRKGLQVSSKWLFWQAMPFSLGAFVFFAGVLGWAKMTNLAFGELIPSLFVALAAISAPHIWYMSKFYQPKG